MTLYIAKIVFRIVNSEGTSQGQYDEQLCLVEARDEREAFIKARLLGVKNEEEVQGDDNRKVFWKFIDVPYLALLGELKDGMEIYARIHEAEPGEGYEKYVKLRALQLQNSFERKVMMEH